MLFRSIAAQSLLTDQFVLQSANDPATFLAHEQMKTNANFQISDIGILQDVYYPGYEENNGIRGLKYYRMSNSELVEDTTLIIQTLFDSNFRHGGEKTRIIEFVFAISSPKIAILMESMECATCRTQCNHVHVCRDNDVVYLTALDIQELDRKSVV